MEVKGFFCVLENDSSFLTFGNSMCSHMLPFALELAQLSPCDLNMDRRVSSMTTEQILLAKKDCEMQLKKKLVSGP